MSRFSKRVGQNNLNKIIDKKVIKLLKTQQNSEVDVVLDASFIKAWSTRHPTDNQIGFSDSQARVGRSGRSYALGYKMHLSIDHKTMLPISSVFVSANQNEKKHSLTLIEKAKEILKHCKAKVRSVVADSQYSDSKLRSVVEKATIPYPANHRKGVEGLLRVDRKFRTYGSMEDKAEYHKRPLIEAVNSFLKTQFSMANNKVRGLAQVTFYALCSILCLVLNREAAQRIGRHEKAVSPTYFNT
jgi:transposase